MFQVKTENCVKELTVDEKPTGSSKFAIEAVGDSEKDVKDSVELAITIFVSELS